MSDRSRQTNYAGGRNYLVTPQDSPAYARRFGRLEVTVCNLEGIGADAAA